MVLADTLQTKLVEYGLIAAAIGLAAWYLTRKLQDPASLEAGAKAAAGVAVDAVDSIFTGAVKGVGEKLGIPDTNLSECERAKREGRTWDASFACPAGDFLGYLFGRSTPRDTVPHSTRSSGSGATW